MTRQSGGFYSIDGLHPMVGRTSFIHPSADIIGDVTIGEHVYIGPGVRLRGDMGRIVIGDGANVQDNCVLHGWPTRDTVVEKDGHLGHAAIVHGAHVAEGALIGMNAVILDGAQIGEYAVIGAQALVSTDTHIPARTLAVGVPAKVKRDLSPQEIELKRKMTNDYQLLVERCRKSLKAVEPLEPSASPRSRIQSIYPDLTGPAPD